MRLARRFYNTSLYNISIRMASTAKRVIVPVANGSEDIETVTIVDTLRRAGAEVFLASVEDTPQITAARGIKMIADGKISDVAEQSWDCIALPGGMPGAERLRDSAPLLKLLQKQKDEKKLYAAICASPAVVFQHHGLLDGHKATCHPNFVDKLQDKSKAEERVVVDGNVVTSRAPGTTLEFSLKLVEILYGREQADKVAGPMLVGHSF